MRMLLAAFALIPALAAADITPGTASSYIVHVPAVKEIKPMAATGLTIACGTGAISIDYRTGKVALPDGVSLDAAALRFWQAVAQAFPDARQAIIADHLATEHQKEGEGEAVWQLNGRHIELGTRADGVVVWRLKQEAQP